MSMWIWLLCPTVPFRFWPAYFSSADTILNHFLEIIMKISRPNVLYPKKIKIKVMCSFDREKKIACDQLAPLWTVPSNRFGIGMWHVGFDLRTFRVRDFSFEKEKVKNKKWENGVKALTTLAVSATLTSNLTYCTLDTKSVTLDSAFEAAKLN